MGKVVGTVVIFPEWDPVALTEMIKEPKKNYKRPGDGSICQVLRKITVTEVSHFSITTSAGFCKS